MFAKRICGYCWIKFPSKIIWVSFMSHLYFICDGVRWWLELGCLCWNSGLSSYELHRWLWQLASVSLLQRFHLQNGRLLYNSPLNSITRLGILLLLHRFMLLMQFTNSKLLSKWVSFHIRCQFSAKGETVTIVECNWSVRSGRFTPSEGRSL